MSNPMSSKSQFRLGYTDLQNRDGTLRTNVLADISLHGYAPVLKNPICKYFFLEAVGEEVDGLNLKNPQKRMFRTAIFMLKRMGYYCRPAPSGLVAKYHFYVDFLKML